MNSPGWTALIGIDEFTRHRRPDWRVFDCRHDLVNPDFGRKAYADGHLPGAVHLHLDADLSGPMTGSNGRHPLPDARRFAARMAELGVGDTSQVVAYDDAGGMYAARLWWLLRWIGHEPAAVLDGGLQAWLGAGLPLTQDMPDRVPATLTVRLREAAVDAGYVLEHLESSAMILIDARSPDRYRGENESLDPVAGHIPGASNRFFRDNLGAGGSFKAPAQLRAEFEAILAGCDPRHVVHQCGSGVTACHNLLAMEAAGLAGSRLYPGSWSEWCSDRRRPVARG